jgi:hypothetical protein
MVIYKSRKLIWSPSAASPKKLGGFPGLDHAILIFPTYFLFFKRGNLSRISFSAEIR